MHRDCIMDCLQVWADLKSRKRFDMSPDELAKCVPSLKELDDPTMKDLWIQVRDHPRIAAMLVLDSTLQRIYQY